MNLSLTLQNRILERTVGPSDWTPLKNRVVYFKENPENNYDYEMSGNSKLLIRTMNQTCISEGGKEREKGCATYGHMMGSPHQQGKKTSPAKTGKG